MQVMVMVRMEGRVKTVLFQAGVTPHPWWHRSRPDSQSVSPLAMIGKPFSVRETVRALLSLSCRTVASVDTVNLSYVCFSSRK